MKFSTIIFISILALGCSPEKPSEDQSESASAEKKTVQILQWLSMSGNSEMPHIVFISGDEEYRSEEALPQLAKILSERHGFKCTVLFAQDPDFPGIVDANYGQNIPGLHHLETADLMVIFTRFRALPNEQMKYIDDYLKAGKPVIGMRTSTHAFKFNDVDMSTDYAQYGNYYNGDDNWKEGFGRLVLGEKWISHHGKHGHQSTKGLLTPQSIDHPITNGISDGDVWGPTDVYGVRLPMPKGCQTILLGQVTDRSGDFDENDPLLGMRPSDHQVPGVIQSKNKEGKEVKSNQNDPMMPVAWTKSYQIPGGKEGKCFATTMGAATDLLQEGTRRLMVNSVFWCLELDVPAKAEVDLVGNYQPTRFEFKKDEYWDNRKMQISSLQE